MLGRVVPRSVAQSVIENYRAECNMDVLYGVLIEKCWGRVL